LPGNYPSSNPSRFYVNNGGTFTRLESELFNTLGLIKDAVAGDYNGDGKVDLIVAGEWTNVQLLKNTGKGFELDNSNISSKSGLWQNMILEDFDGDGDLDLIAGNLGLNTQLCASDKEPLTLNVADFDGNGRLDPIISCFIQGESFPIYSRDELLDHIVPLKKVYNTYESYSDVNTKQLLENFKEVESTVYKANEIGTIYFENVKGKFVEKAFPIQIQAAPVYAMLAEDIDNDGDKDLIVGGNNTHARVRIGNISANHGQVFINDGKGNFAYLPQYKSGLAFKGEVRSLQIVNGKLVVARNMGSLLFYGMGEKPLQ
jgi:enediyne biosynthesis protein E4